MRTPRKMAGLLMTILIVGGVTVTGGVAQADDLTLVAERQIGGTGHAELYAWGMATALDGSILIGDYWNFRIAHYATDGTYLGSLIDDHGEGLTQHQSPYGIATDPVNGDIYFGDVDGGSLPDSSTPFGNMVDKYDANGNYLTSWGTKGSGVGKYKYPSYVAVASNRNVYVSDQWDHNIVVNSPTGQELFQFGSQGNGNGQFQQPRGLAFDAQGRLFVADNYNQRIQVFDGSGNFLFKFSGPGTTPGKLGNDLRGLAIDKAHGWVYIADTTSGFISKFDTNGNFLMRWGGYGSLPGQFVHGGRGVTVDQDGNVWVGDMGAFRAQKFDSNGNFLLQVPSAPTWPPDGGFNQPRGVAVDTLGNVFVTDTQNQRIQKFAPDGTFIKWWGTRGGDNYKYNYPRGIAVDPRDNSVVVADTDNHRVKKYTNDGVFLWSKGGIGTLPGQFHNFHGLDVGPDGKIYVADTLNRRVQVLDPSGNPLLVFGSQGNGNGQFQFDRNIAADPDGSIWVSDSIRNNVQHFSATGQYLGVLGTSLNPIEQLSRPDDLEVDATHVFVADADNDMIKVWHKDGTFEGSYGGSGTQLGQFLRPHGLDLVGGKLYVAEQTGERVQVLNVTGGGSSDVTAPDTAVVAPTTNQSVPLGTVPVSGTATDDVGVFGVSVFIKNTSTSQWWTGSQWGSYTPLSATLASPGATSTAWSYNWPAPAAGSYAVQAQARDGAGNVDLTMPYVPFSVFVDSVAPDGTVSIPTANQTFTLGQITFSGNATDNSGVTAAEIMIKDVAANKYWNGSTWVAAFTWLSPGATLGTPGGTSTTWTYGWTPAAIGQFAMSVRAKDAGGNVDGTRPWVTFTVVAGGSDSVAPDGTISYPMNNQTIPAGVTVFTGSATDNVGVTKVEVMIKDRATNLFWNGSTWVTIFTWLSPGATLGSPGAISTPWSYTQNLAAGIYAVSVRARDAAGNMDGTRPWYSFTVN